MTATNKNWLEDLKPGDNVIIGRHLHDSVIEKVSKITPTQIVISYQGIGSVITRRFAKKDCYEIGAMGATFIPYLVEASQENVKAIKDKIRLGQLKEWFNKVAHYGDLATLEKMIFALSPEDRARLKVPQGE